VKMKLTIIRAKGITLSGKGYLVGINNIYVIEGLIFSFTYKKYAEKFVKMVLQQLETNKNLLEVMKKEYDKYLSVERKQSQNDILDKIRLKCFELRKVERIQIIDNDKQLLDFAKDNIKKINIENLDNYLYYCN
ncbi:MAG: hypothetical protein ACRCVJ_18870, partial [Clostridium sp.]|uniref:hypothetical protein n=1 Tax=Clostridium sp. TaxID=1506 RepID=UPI003F345944